MSQEEEITVVVLLGKEFREIVLLKIGSFKYG